MDTTLRGDWKGPSFKFWHTYKWFDLQRAIFNLTQFAVTHNVLSFKEPTKITQLMNTFAAGW